LSSREKEASRPSRSLDFKVVAGVLLLLLLAISLAANAYLYSLATRPLYAASDRPLIERTLARAAIAERTNPEELRAGTFPIVLEIGGRTCVDIRNTDGGGHYAACYDRAGRLVEQIAGVDF
jgi:hypothetical protein